MKKIFIYLAAIIIFSTTACEKFLTIDPVGVINEKSLQNDQGLEWMMTGMYAHLYQGGNQSSLADFTYGDVVSGDANKGSEANDQPDWGALETFKFTASNGYVTSPWRNYYNGVFKSNVVLDMLDDRKVELAAKAGVTKDFLTEAQAQARFLRGIWYFELIKLYSAAVPWVGLEEYRSSVNPQVSNVDATGNYIFIWDKVIADFEYAYENLPDVWPSASQGRPNKWAAAAYLAKVKMFQSSPYNGKNNQVNRWGEVKTLLETIMAQGKTSSGKPYALHTSYAELFTAGKSDNTNENVFDIQQAVVGTQTNTNTTWGAGSYNAPSKLNGGWGFLQPSQDLAQSYMVDAAGIPYTNNGYRSFPAVSVRVGSTTTVNTNLSVYMDPRIDFNLSRFGIPFYDWDVPTAIDGYIRDVSSGGIYFQKKHLPRKADKGTLSVTNSATSTTKNIHLIRYADILLWYAEALIETGTPAAARTYVNQVRARAGKSFVGAARLVGTTVTATTSTYVMNDLFTSTTAANAAANYRVGPWPVTQFATAAGATEALRAEYRAEFGMEGRRWYDLTRWGVAAPVLNSYAAYEKGFLNKYNDAVYNESYVCMPIPLAEIITMQGLLVQTENWK